MEKKLNKIEMNEEVEIKEEAKVEELTEETLDKANGGSMEFWGFVLENLLALAFDDTFATY